MWTLFRTLYEWYIDKLLKLSLIYVVHSFNVYFYWMFAINVYRLYSYYTCSAFLFCDQRKPHTMENTSKIISAQEGEAVIFYLFIMFRVRREINLLLFGRCKTDDTGTDVLFLELILFVQLTYIRHHHLQERHLFSSTLQRSNTLCFLVRLKVPGIYKRTRY